MNERPSPPFKTLGSHLKYLREQLNESVAEVSGAVEIDSSVLERIERGDERPSEDILMLLINHFGMQDNEAVRLWELAGYTGDERFRLSEAADDLSAHGKQIIMLFAMDMRTQYTDGVQVNANPAGVTLHFTQATGQPQPLPVARVGMSLEQAEKVKNLLEQALLHVKYSRPKGLPPSKEDR